MEITDLTKETEATYFNCLEDWSEEIREGHPHKENWYRKTASKGLRVKIAKTPEGAVTGMIQYLPAEHSFVRAENIYVVLCIWVHGHPQGIGNRQGAGTGKALLEAAEKDVRELGAGGLAVWGLSIPAFMKASWFRKQGYKTADKFGIQVLLWKKFRDDAVTPEWYRPLKKPAKLKGTAEITIFRNGWCQVQNMVSNRIIRAAEETGDSRINVTVYDTSDRSIFLEWGISDAVFINGKEIRTGPPPSYDKIKKILNKHLKRI